MISCGKIRHFFVHLQREVKETPPVVMKGSSGSPCDVTANFVRLNFEENSVFEYEVVFDPDQDYKHLRFKLLNGLLFISLRFIIPTGNVARVPSFISNTHFLNYVLEHNAFFKQKTFDGTTLYVPHMLPPEALKLVSTNPYDESKVNITVS